LFVSYISFKITTVKEEKRDTLLLLALEWKDRKRYTALYLSDSKAFFISSKTFSNTAYHFQPLKLAKCNQLFLSASGLIIEAFIPIIQMNQKNMEILQILSKTKI